MFEGLSQRKWLLIEGSNAGIKVRLWWKGQPVRTKGLAAISLSKSTSPQPVRTSKSHSHPGRHRLAASKHQDTCHWRFAKSTLQGLRRPSSLPSIFPAAAASTNSRVFPSKARCSRISTTVHWRALKVSPSRSSAGAASQAFQGEASPIPTPGDRSPFSHEIWSPSALHL